MVNIEAIIYYAFFLDSIGANIMAWFFPSWYKKTFKGVWKHLPATKGWALFYFILVLWIGCALYRLGILPY
ncbi:hypothetical protein CMI37_22380 [Candidatus Pacearchaeota archaeon]|nr:hypothetical protein [Candidatus Pacearchaeota archaeon]|tara:strand:+ start:583 stop:795 length:213 start_codon:yes stop_codon:yes gene_type:complete